tara:strand:+ start:14551 stop:15474 length:924 start_codon:yes stop_codon:yes gene_type:complete
MAAFNLTILGSNSAVPAHNRYPSSQVLRCNQMGILIDCGEGAQFQMNKFHIKRGRLDYILISHMHGDHYFGLVGLLNSFKLNNRQHAIHIYGPPELEPIISLQTNYKDSNWPYPLHFYPIRMEEVYTLFETEELIVSTIPLKHKIACNGFLIREKLKARKILAEAIRAYEIPNHAIKAIKNGEDFIQANGDVIHNGLLTANPPDSFAYAYCSDTLYDETIVPHIKGVDVLYHEATFGEESRDKAALRFHSTAKQAANIAKKAGVGQLIIGHYSAKYKDLSPLLLEAQEIFPATVLAKEGSNYSIPND